MILKWICLAVVPKTTWTSGLRGLVSSSHPELYIAPSRGLFQLFYHCISLRQCIGQEVVQLSLAPRSTAPAPPSIPHPLQQVPRPLSRPELIGCHTSAGQRREDSLWEGLGIYLDFFWTSPLGFEKPLERIGDYYIKFDVTKAKYFESKSLRSRFHSSPKIGSSMCRALTEGGMEIWYLSHPFNFGFGSISSFTKRKGNLFGSTSLPAVTGGGVGSYARTCPSVVWIPDFHSFRQCGTGWSWCIENHQ